MTLDLEGIKKRYPDPESDIDAEPHEWADGILGEWANGGATSIRATGGNIFQAAYKDIGRIWDEWSARGDAIQSLIAEVERLREENEKLVKVLAMADVLVEQTQARVAKLEKVRKAAMKLVRPGEPFEPALISLRNTLAEASE